MHRLRLCLFLLLAIAVPLQGYAHFAQPLVLCPMENTAMMAMLDADAAHDCCDDAESGSQTGKACKSGQPCQSGGQHFSVSTLGVLPQMPVLATRFPRIAAFTFSLDPAATWRPPSQS